MDELHVLQADYSAKSKWRIFKVCVFLALAVNMTTGFSGCSSGSGSDNTFNPDTTQANVSDGVTYTGDVAAKTSDVTSFQINVWNNLATQNRCGSCHVEGGQTPMFVRGDDINLAYDAANTIVNRTVVAESRIVTKVAAGHNCWESEASVCASIISRYIDSWVSSSSSATTVTLTAPDDEPVGAFISFPELSSFANTLYPTLRTYCSDCHAEDGTQAQQQPFFASGDTVQAYEAAKSKIDLNKPQSSRFYVRLKDESHNCWSNCDADSQTILNNIESLISAAPITEVDSALVVSRAVDLANDGIIASSGGRYETDVIALYEFKNDSVTTAFDTSGVDPSLNLNLSGEVSKLNSWGLRIENGKAQGATGDSSKLFDLISLTGEYSIEAWVVPDNVNQDGPARIVSYSGGSDDRNFTLGQTLYNYDFLNRSSATDGNGLPALSTADDEEVLQASLQHVVATFDAASGRHLYVNGVEVAAEDVGENGAGTLSDWDNSFALVLGNEVSNDNLWKGTIRLLAIHNRVLTTDQIAQNYEAGVGEKFYLLFGVSHLIPQVPQAFIVFEVQVFDDYSYLFSSPFFTSTQTDFDASDLPASGITLKGIRIGVNGVEAETGQAYVNIDTKISAENYGKTLSDVGTVINLVNGVDNGLPDQFFLSFASIGTENSPAKSDPGAVVPPDLSAIADADKPSRIGLRTFEEISASLSRLTGVSSVNSEVAATFAKVKQQLPTVENIDGFLASHQMGVTQLAVEYCSELVNDTSLRAQYFADFNAAGGFNASVASAFSASGKSNVIAPLVEKLLTDYLPAVTESAEGPDTRTMTAVTEQELEQLMDSMISCSNCGTDQARTQAIVKATCAAAVGGAVMILQ